MTNQLRLAVAERVDNPYLHHRAHTGGRYRPGTEQVDYVFHDSRQVVHGAIVGRDRRGAVALTTRIARGAEANGLAVEYITPTDTPIESVASLARRMHVGRGELDGASAYYFNQVRRPRPAGSPASTLLIVDASAAVFHNRHNTWDCIFGGATAGGLSVLALTWSMRGHPRSPLARRLDTANIFNLRPRVSDDRRALAIHVPDGSLFRLPEPERFSYGYATFARSHPQAFAVDLEAA